MYMRMPGVGFLQPDAMAAVRRQIGQEPITGGEVVRAAERQRREQEEILALAMRAQAEHDRQQRVAFWKRWGIVLGVGAAGLVVVAFNSGRRR